MLVVAITLATTIWTTPSGPSANRQSADRLPAPQVVMRWDAPSGLPAVPAAKPDMSPVCKQLAAQKAGASDKGLFWGNKDAPIAGVRKLGEEPNADTISAVLYTEGACIKSVVISRDTGINPRQR